MTMRYKIKAAVFLLTFLYSYVKGQSLNMDSLSKIVHALQPSQKFELSDTNYLNVISLLNKQFYESGKSDSMHVYATKGLAIVKKLKESSYNKIKSNVLTNFEMLFNRQAGISYFDKGDYTNQLNYFHRFLLCAQSLNSVKDVATAYVYIATCHRELEDIEQSFFYSKKAVATLAGHDYPSTLASAYSLMSNYYIDGKANNDSAYYYRKEAYLILKESSNNPLLLVSSTLDLVELFHDFRQTDSCKKYLDEIEPLVGEMQNPEHLTVFNAYKGQVYLSEKKTASAVELLRKARALADETDDLNDNSQVNRVLALALAADGKVKEAFDVMDSAFDEYSEDLNTEKVRSLTQAQMNFDFEKERTIASVELKRQRQLRYFLIGLTAILLLFIGFVFQRYRERHHTSLVLAEKNATIEKAYTDLKDAQEDLVETEKQREAQSIRVRIARDIHDEIGSVLTKITLLSDTAKSKSQQTEIADSLSKITFYSKGVSSSLSEIVWAINPGYDNVASLVGYMKTTARNLLEDSGVNYRLSFPDNEISTNIHPEIKRNIYLVMKEAINNSLKYANAENMTVNFQVEQKKFRLEVTDDGDGFNIEKTEKTGNGIFNMQQRMTQHNNTLQIISSLANGCRVIAEGNLI